MAKRSNYSPESKARVTLAALANEKTIAELSLELGIHQNLVNKWKAQLKESVSDILAGDSGKEDAKREKELHDLHAKISQLTVERDFLAQVWG